MFTYLGLSPWGLDAPPVYTCWGGQSCLGVGPSQFLRPFGEWGLPHARSIMWFCHYTMSSHARGYVQLKSNVTMVVS